MHLDLAREADIRCNFAFAGQSSLLDLGLRSGVTAQNLDPTRRATAHCRRIYA